MEKVYFRSDNIITSLGLTTAENFKALLDGKVGIKSIYDPSIYPDPVPASLTDHQKIQTIFEQFVGNDGFTLLEKMIIISIYTALSETHIDPSSAKTLFIISTTKGNIDLLEPGMIDKFDKNRQSLWRFGDIISNHYKNPNKAILLSNACISGVLALNIAASQIRSKHFDHVIVTGGDLVTGFVVSGFMSFLSLSTEPCRPFDQNRNGLSLGEGAGTIIMSKEPGKNSNIIHLGGASANDANHISGPSRTGEGSYIAIQKALKEAQVLPAEIDHISAHGTATSYNDEMESIAISRSNLENVPLNSFKGNWGHTLGAAGIIETAAMLEEMRNNTMVASAGYEKLGVSKPIHVLRENKKAELFTSLKMASGFGGTNAALIARKVNE